MRAFLSLSAALFLAGAAHAQDVGKPAKEIEAKEWINSEGTSLAKLAGKVVVLEFWATW